MINWTEEDVKFVCNTMVVPAMEQVMKMVDVSYDSNYKSIEAVVGALDKVNYQHKREISFLQTIARSLVIDGYFDTGVYLIASSL